MSETASPADVEAALADGVVVGRTELDVISVTGDDADDYLQGQLSQDVTGLRPGDTRWTLLLQPQGKVDAWMRIHRLDADRLWLLVDPGHGETALDRLERFKLRVDVDMSLDHRPVLALRGAGAVDLAKDLADDRSVAVDASWGPIPGIDVVGVDAAVDHGEVPDGVVAADDTALELVRVLQGRPLMGRELDSSTIPNAAGVVDGSVDFTKGCYVGQELVARIDSRGGNTPTRLVGVIGTSDVAPTVPVALVVDDAEVGTLTSAAASTEGFVGLAYIKRAVEVPSTAVVDTAGSSVTVNLHPLGPSDPSDSSVDAI